MQNYNWVCFLYGCEIWSLTVREKRRLRLFKNGVLRTIFRPKRDEVIGDWTKLHNDELYDLYFSPNIIWVIKSRRMRLEGHVGGRRGTYRVLVGKRVGKKQLVTSKHRYKDNIKIDLQEVSWRDIDWTVLVQGMGRGRRL